MRVDYASNGKFEVRNTKSLRWSVDLVRKECTCRKRQRSGMSYAHAISSILLRRINIGEFLDEYYKKDAYLRAYNPLIHPILGLKLWPGLGKNPLKAPVKKK